MSPPFAHTYVFLDSDKIPHIYKGWVVETCALDKSSWAPTVDALFSRSV